MTGLSEGVADPSAMRRGRSKRQPERRCLVSRAVMAPEQMLRFVRAPDGSVVADIKAKLPGRGAWVEARHDRVLDAVTNKRFSHAFRQKVIASPSLPGDVADLMRSAARGKLSMANKSGAVITGAEKIRSSLEGSAIITVLHAVDAGADGVTKIEQKLRHLASGSVPDILNPVDARRVFDVTEMSLALGRSNVVHAGLRESGASRAFLHELARYVLYMESAHNLSGNSAA